VNRILFFPYLLANYPGPAQFSEILDITLQYADTVEIGIPFTDPVADGPVIAKAASEVLASGFAMDSVFKRLQQNRKEIPIAIMSYANPILGYGKKDFLAACVQSGVKHLIVPDVPFEESMEWRGIVKEYGLSWISFVSLSTSEPRLKAIAQAAEGFLYLLSLKGITGSTIHHPEQIREKAHQIKNYTDVPIALGFGLKSVQDTVPYQDVVNAFIVGSRILELIHSNGLMELENFYKTFWAQNA
jgi:tryptophan synthase alpha chain